MQDCMTACAETCTTPSCAANAVVTSKLDASSPIITLPVVSNEGVMQQAIAMFSKSKLQFPSTQSDEVGKVHDLEQYFTIVIRSLLATCF